MLKLKLAGLKLQVTYICTGGNTNLLNRLTSENRQLSGSLGSTDGKGSSREARTGCALGKAANKELLFVLMGAAVTLPGAGGRKSIRGGARIFRYDL